MQEYPVFRKVSIQWILMNFCKGSLFALTYGLDWLSQSWYRLWYLTEQVNTFASQAECLPHKQQRQPNSNVTHYSYRQHWAWFVQWLVTWLLTLAFFDALSLLLWPHQLMAVCWQIHITVTPNQYKQQWEWLKFRLVTCKDMTFVFWSDLMWSNL